MRADIKAFLKTALSTKGDGPCLEWPFTMKNENYGGLYLNGKILYAHRVVCELAHGAPSSPKLNAAHSCHNKLCCRPSHLRWATRSENAKDQRSRTDDKSYKLTASQVADIKRSSMGPRKLAKVYTVSHSIISMIKTGKRWQ